MSFGREFSLKRRKDFIKVREGGLYRACQNVVVQAIPIEEERSPHFRVGYTATRKIGNAIVRNRCKRRLREAATVILNENNKNFDYVLIARRGCAECNWNDLLSQLRNAIDWIHNRSITR